MDEYEKMVIHILGDKMIDTLVQCFKDEELSSKNEKFKFYEYFFYILSNDSLVKDN